MTLWYLDPRHWYYRWFVPRPIYLDIRDDGSMTMRFPDPATARRRERLQTMAKNQWTIGIGCTLLGVVLGKLL
jgi:hypothetical protein